MECYLSREPKVRGYRKRILSLWLNKGMFWVSEQRLVDQANTIHKDSCTTELEIEEMERNLAENDSYMEKERSADDAGDNLREEVKDILTALKVYEEIGKLEEEEVAIIEEITLMLERRQKDKLLALIDMPKKKLLEEPAKVGKALCKFKTPNINQHEKGLKSESSKDKDKEVM